MSAFSVLNFCFLLSGSFAGGSSAASSYSKVALVVSILLLIAAIWSALMPSSDKIFLRALVASLEMTKK